MPRPRPGAAGTRLRVPGAGSGVNTRLPRRATRNGERGARTLRRTFAAAASAVSKAHQAAQSS